MSKIPTLAPGSSQSSVIDRVNLLIRARPAGVATATSGSDSYVTPQSVVCPTLWPVATVSEHPTNGTYVIGFYVQPVDPSTGAAPTGLQIRGDAAMSLVTYAAHPLSKDQEWSIVPTANPYEFEVEDSVYEDSIWLEGHCYVPGTLEDGSEIVNDMLEWCRTRSGPTMVQMPPGFVYVQNETIRVPEVVNFAGVGLYKSGFCLADRADQPNGANPSVVSLSSLLAAGAGDSSAYGTVGGLWIHGHTFYGNRGFQIYQRGTHAINIGGSESNVAKRNNQRFTDNGVFGSAGYGIKISGDDSPAIGVEIENVKIKFSDGDGSDTKNRSDENRLVVYRNVEVWYWAMGEMGTDLKPNATLPTDPVTTVSGSPDFTIPRYAYLPDAAGGEICTLNGPTYNGINLSASFKCMGVSGDTVMLRGTQNATGSGTGGGSGIVAAMPHYSHGDSALDTRAPECIIDGAWIEGHFFGRNGPRQRGGLAGSSNGRGSENMVFNNIRGKDTSPAWAADAMQGEVGSLISLEGTGATVNSPKFEGTGCSHLVRASAASSNVTINNAVAWNARNGYFLQCESGQVNGGTIRDWVLHGARVHGGEYSVTKDLGEDPFRCQTIGTAVVIVTDVAHGLSTGNDVAFIGPQSAYGVVIERSNIRDYSITVLTADTYSIVAAGSATNATDSFGGSEVDVRYQEIDHTATNIQIRGVTFEQTDPSNTARPLCIGADREEADLGKADGIVITNCHSIDAGGRVIDSGENVTWGPGNTGDLVDYNPGDGLATSVWEEVAGGDVTVTDAVANLDFTQITKPNVRIEIEGGQHDDAASNIKIYVSPDKLVTIRETNGDYERIGDSAGTSFMVIVGSIAAATAFSAVVEITNFTRPLKSMFKIRGGAHGGTGSLNDYPGFTTAAEALNALRLEVDGNFTAGRFRVYQRDG